MDKLIINDLEIEIIRKKIKNIHLSIHPPEGRIRVAVPEKIEDEAVRLFVISKLSWIKNQRAKFDLQVRHSPREYVSGESHYYLGTRYLLNVIESNGKQRVEIRNKKVLDLYVRPNSTSYKRSKVMEVWYRERLKEIIPKYIEKWESILGVSVSDWGVKIMKTKWGTCNFQSRRIWINIELAKKNPRCIEYIVVHELVHFLERSHNEKFTNYMDNYIPNWRSIRDELNEVVFESDKWKY